MFFYVSALCHLVFLLFKVHKENIDAVPNAAAGRDNIEIEIYGMEGIPEKDAEAKRQAVEAAGWCHAKLPPEKCILSQKLFNGKIHQVADYGWCPGCVYTWDLLKRKPKDGIFLM